MGSLENRKNLLFKPGILPLGSKQKKVSIVLEITGPCYVNGSGRVKVLTLFEQSIFFPLVPVQYNAALVSPCLLSWPSTHPVW